MARSAAERRLIRILTDEDYGPKLARLRGEDESYVLRLIDQNKGKEARREIVRLDEERRARQRTTRREPQRPAPRPVITRRERERRAIQNILSKAEGRGDRKRVSRNVKFMTIDELDFAAEASFRDLRNRAVELPDRETDSGDELNPFWYH